MSTLIELTEQELIELQTLTQEAEPTAAIRSAVTEYVRFARRMRLKELSGRVTMEDNWRTLEQAEMREWIVAGDLVLVDTCIWVVFFNRPHSVEKETVDALLDDDGVAIIGPILTEVLLGFRRDQQADWIASELRGLRYLDVVWDEWRAAA